MKWFFRCPQCKDLRAIYWSARSAIHQCQRCLFRYVPPTPADQHDAHVDEHDWPQEMEDEVRRLRGERCTVPGCTERGDTLDHRIAWEKNGRTSVENLWPMCGSHNSSKGTKNYDTWCKELNLERAIAELTEILKTR